jgi:NDP-sugar pyrophosphorylase family protein
MVEILGIPILGYQLQWLQTQGISDVVIACGYRSEVIRNYFGIGEKWDVRIQYAVEPQPLGRGGALKLAFGFVPPGEQICLATNGDVITNLPLQPLLEAHRKGGDLATIVLAPYTSPYGIVESTDTNKIVAFHEKPDLPYWINAGIYVLAREIESMLPANGDHEVSTFPQLAEARRLGAFKFQGYWRSVDTAKDLSEVHKELEKRLLSSFLA